MTTECANCFFFNMKKELNLTAPEKQCPNLVQKSPQLFRSLSYLFFTDLSVFFKILMK